MKELDQILNIPGLYSIFSRTSPDAANAMFEARNINKDYLKQEADATGDPTRFQTARQSVQTLWAQEDMNNQLNEKAAQKVLNFLYLMEIRSPGFTTPGKLHAIHDLYVGNMLDTKFLSAVNSDTTPEQAEQALSSATTHQVKQNKVYPDLTDAEEAIWNRVKVYHEFDDGFKWVYAVNADGTIASHIPSSITFKTMHHCGNTPNAKSDNQYWELRGPDGKAYLTVILTPDGKIEESKSWGNQPNRYRRMIQPYVKWFFKNKVSGVGYRYDYGYATHSNFGVKDFMGEDPEFIEYVTENKPELLGNTEKRIMFWTEALEQGILTVDDIKRMFMEGLTMEQVLERYGNVREYKGRSRFSDWGENQRNYYYNRDASAFGSNPFDVVCAACGGCPFTVDELKQLIAEKKISLEEFANYDIHLLDADMQKAFVAATPDSLNTLMRIASEVGTFEVADDIMTPLVDTLRKGRPTPPPNYFSMNWHERSENPEALAYDKAFNRWESAKYSVVRYMARTNPPEKARPVVDAVFGDQQVMHNIFDDGEDQFGLNPAFYRRFVEDWLRILARYSDIEIPEVLEGWLEKFLFSADRKDGRTMSLVLRIGRPRIDRLFANRQPGEITNACLDTWNHMKLDARNLMTTVQNLGEFVKMFPEYANIYSVIRPSLRLGYCCCAPREAIDVDAAVDMAVSQIRKGEKIPYDKNAMLSANGAATMMAISAFPEIKERVSATEIGDYVFPQATMIEHTYISDGPMVLSEQLVDILKEAYMSYNDYYRRDYADNAATVFMVASYRYNTLKEGDPIFNEIYTNLAHDRPTCHTLELLTGYHFFPDIPRDEWDNVISRIDTRNRDDGTKIFVETYILPALNNGRYADNQDMMDFLLDYIMGPKCSPTTLHNDLFRKRPILNKLKRLIAERISGGSELSVEQAYMLNNAGLLNKEFLTQAQLKHFDEQSEGDIDESISGKIDQMCSDATLKKYKKARNFPYFVNELLRAILEQYDMEYTKVARTKGTYSMDCDEVSFRMYARFSKVADCIASTPKAPYCVAAAKLAGRSGLLDAYRMVAERYGQGDDRRPLIMMRYRPYGEPVYDFTTDLSPDFNDKIGKLEQMAGTKQKYKAEEGELPMKQK